MTNGTPSSITVNITSGSGHDTTHGVTIVAGTEIGVKIVTATSSTAVSWEWSFEGW
jgi:hypothetical protein